MHTTPTALSPAHRTSFVDEDALICPGCLDQVRAEGPTFAHGLEPESDAGFFHRDGSVLCADHRGRACEPIEAA
jgi:hypothetical protein